MTEQEAPTDTTPSEPVSPDASIDWQGSNTIPEAALPAATPELTEEPATTDTPEVSE